MPSFKFKSLAEITLYHEPGEKKSHLTSTSIKLETDPKVTTTVYLTPDYLPTAEGIKIMTQCFIQGAMTAAKVGAVNGWIDFRGQVTYVMQEFLRCAEAFEKENETKVTMGTMDDMKEVRMSTNKDLADQLTARNKDGDYNRIIDKARRNHYHDFKQPDDAEGIPKANLLVDLAAFPELADIRQWVIDGKYDEAPDEEDDREMAAMLMKGLGSKTADGEETNDADDMQYSPKLKKAVAEIKDILVKYDIAGLVQLSDGAYAEFLTQITPTWSCAFVEGGTLRVRARAKEDYKGDIAARNKALDLTVNMIDSFAVIMGPLAMAFMDLTEELRKTTNFESGPVTITSHTQQNQ